MAFQCKFEVLKDSDQRAYGIKLVALPHSESEVFVDALVRAVRDKTREADIRYCDGELVFQINSAVHRQPVAREDQEKVFDLFNDPEVMWQDKWTPGLAPGLQRIALNRVKGQR